MLDAAVTPTSRGHLYLNRRSVADGLRGLNRSGRRDIETSSYPILNDGHNYTNLFRQKVPTTRAKQKCITNPRAKDKLAAAGEGHVAEERKVGTLDTYGMSELWRRRSDV